MATSSMKEATQTVLMSPLTTQMSSSSTEDAQLQVSASPPSSKTFGMQRTKSLFSMASDVSSSATETVSSVEDPLIEEDDIAGDAHRAQQFGLQVRMQTQESPETLTFDAGLRKILEPHLRRARQRRSRARRSPIEVDASIADSLGVPYTVLRHERPFLFDEHSFPMHRLLAEALGVEDLSCIQGRDEEELLLPLLDAERRRAFHSAYDSFVTSFCIPLLHSLAIAKNIVHTSSDRITYRYQAFPTIQVRQPGSVASPPICDTALGHSIGCLTFYIPLTRSEGTAALYAESHPGREDWHPLIAKSVGLGYLFDGARCLYFEPSNTTDYSRVSLQFKVLLYRDRRHDSGYLCADSLLEDDFSKSDYYEEAIVDVGRSLLVTRKYGNRLLTPCQGPPFV